MNTIFSQKTPEQLLKMFKTDFNKGLSPQEALQRLTIYGNNQINALTQETFYQKLKKQFQDLLVIILLMAAAINLTIGIFQNKHEEIYEACFILFIVLGNALLSIYYENKTQQALSFVEKKVALRVKVVRDNKHLLIPMVNLVPGDIVILETGDLVSADMRLLESFNLTVDESLFTGESQAILKQELTLPQNKNIADLSLVNMVFMNTVVLKGRGKGLVVATGMKTEIGKITTFIAKPQITKTPLEQKLTKLIKTLTLLISMIVILNALIVLLKQTGFGCLQWDILQSTFLDSLALTVAAIPEGLLIIMTLILALGMKKLTVLNAIVKNLKTLETLGAVNVICTDKTGTLTQNKMTVKQIITADALIAALPLCHAFSLNPHRLMLEKLMLFGVLCNDALISPKPNQKLLEVFADPTEKALINLALFYQMDVLTWKKKYVRLGEIPFDAQRKLMTTFNHNMAENTIYQITKGAPEVLLKRSHQVMYQGRIIPKDDRINHILEKQISQLTQQSLRVLGIAYSILPFDPAFKIDQVLQPEYNLIFVGVVALEDPIRPEVFQAIAKCQAAYVTPIMITGDHLQTAMGIAQKLNILATRDDLAITGETLNHLSEAEFLDKLEYIKVYARTNPQHKLKIVKAWQKKGFVVSMTGDGVNDALSIKQANIGIAMGITGTHVAKMASDMILTDDNFATIVKALEAGRNVFNNIKKSLVFLLSCNVGEIMLILLSNLFGSYWFGGDFKILTAFQILWINLVTDSLVAMALGLEPQEQNLMSQKPRQMNENLLNKSIYYKIMIEGCLIASLAFLAALVGYYWHGYNHQYAQTFAFMVLAISQLIHVWNLRSFKVSMFKLKPNLALRKAFGISLLLQLIIILIPAIRSLFKLMPLSSVDYLIIFFFSLCPLIVVEIYKKIMTKSCV
ncbi:cation-translocating P-type ATPase [Candidatus Phytoplasma meliae]|uniref:Cation-translocating P-type ATPase n=1 Tax=Candidatus Phytoplasma meliae TaxID=1848402 RepID=A0ABS5CYV4_9MOLU|nr:cation-translocating P-type ATPase [Candidatus Phytoplasma meliae]MBP5836163.1 cation-translocating P-type ATPase [Candidatus Phytoplasma meliae]MBP5836266.1 cation-translocating P-type ATPase [Candidatus Phytoplasma meliae]